MNNEITSPGAGGPETTDATGNTQMTDFTQVVSCALGRDRQELRRQKIRAELVREHFADDSATSPASLSIRHRLLNLLRIN
ncbi:MAG: hypothetical protein GY802_16425 [Gammaproteobacteria bacterium]|nr:hypothetical protein [Gammaproteobacteria bacterium]